MGSMYQSLNLLGRSQAHASNIVLVSNMKTAHVSLQFHVVFGDDFTEVSYLKKSIVLPKRDKLAKGSEEKTRSKFYNSTATWFKAVPNN